MLYGVPSTSPMNTWRAGALCTVRSKRGSSGTSAPLGEGDFNRRQQGAAHIRGNRLAILAGARLRQAVVHAGAHGIAPARAKCSDTPPTAWPASRPARAGSSIRYYLSFSFLPAFLAIRRYLDHVRFFHQFRQQTQVRFTTRLLQHHFIRLYVRNHPATKFVAHRIGLAADHGAPLARRDESRLQHRTRRSGRHAAAAPLLRCKPAASGPRARRNHSPWLFGS